MTQLVASSNIWFAYRPICLDFDGQVEKELTRLWPNSRWPFRDRRHTEGFHASTIKGNRDPLLESPYPIDPCPHLNELIIPTGAARYAKSLVLMSHKDFLFVAKELWNSEKASELRDIDSVQSLEEWRSLWKPYPAVPITENGNWGEQYFFGNDGRTSGFDWMAMQIKFTSANRLVEMATDRFAEEWPTMRWEMTMLTPQLTVGGLWLLPLVDRRYFLQHRVRSIDMTEFAGRDLEWSDVFAKLSELAGMPINFPDTIDNYYLKPDREIFASPGVGLGQMIDAAAMSVGLRVVPAEEGKELTLQSASESIEQIEKNYYSTEDDKKFPQSGCFYPRAPRPRRVNLISPVLHNYYPCDEQEVTEKTVPNTEPDGDMDREFTVFSTCYAQYKREDFDILSANQLSNLAEKLTNDLAQWWTWSHNGTFMAVASYELTGHDDYWSIGFRGKTINSQIRALPDDFGPRVQLSQAPAFFRHLDDAIICRLTQSVPQINSVTLRMGTTYTVGAASVNATPLIPNDEGELIERTKSDGSPMEILVYHAGSSPITVVPGAEPLVQCKKIGCFPVIDVEYC